MPIPFVPKSSMSLLITCMSISLFSVAPASADPVYPNRTIKIIVPFPAGGTTDLIGRLIAPPLATLSAVRTNRATFDVNKDLTPVTVIANVPMVITAAKSLPAKDLRELATLLKDNKDLDYSYGSTGVGSYLNVIGEMFVQGSAITMMHIPFKGAAPLKQELLAERIQMGGDQLSTSLSEIRAGSLQALAIADHKRSAVLPDVPTVSELGFPELASEGWNGLLAPGNTPKEIVIKIQQAVTEVVHQPEIQQRLAELGAEALGSTSAEHEKILLAQMNQFQPVIETISFE